MSTAPACLAGDWTIHTIAQHRDAMLVLVHDGHTVFDASGITDMDTAGLQLLVATQRSIAALGKELQLQQPSAVVKDVLKSYGLDATLHALYPEEAWA